MTVKKYHTYDEIMAQPNVWRNVYKDIISDNGADLSIFNKTYDEILLFGCGSSYNLAMSAAFFTRTFLINTCINALPSSEILINSEIYLNNSKRYLLVGFSRSGDTTETLEVLNLFKKTKNVNIFTFTCNEDSAITNLSKNSYIIRDAFEQSIVMTASFSSMLFAYCLIISKFLENKNILKDFEDTINFLQEEISGLDSFISDYVARIEFNSYFPLGSEFNYGLAVEADLKMKEMSQINSSSYHLYEFSHGPKAMIDKKSLCLVLSLNRNLIKYERIIEELLNLDSHILVVGTNKIKNIPPCKKIEFVLYNLRLKNDLIKSFINIPVFQFLAFYKTIKNELDPDHPRNLVYTVKI